MTSPISSEHSEGPDRRLKERPVNKAVATGTGSISITTDEEGRFKLVMVTVGFNVKPSTSEEVVLTLDAQEGSAYDSVLRTANPSEGEGTGDVLMVGDLDLIFAQGDALTLTFNNTDSRTFGARIITEPV